jgi:hypothetical protein
MLQATIAQYWLVKTHAHWGADTTRYEKMIVAVGVETVLQSSAGRLFAASTARFEVNPRPCLCLHVPWIDSYMHASKIRNTPL